MYIQQPREAILASEGLTEWPIYNSCVRRTSSEKYARSNFDCKRSRSINMKIYAMRFKTASLTDMRMQPVSADNDALFINDAYNAAPTSMRAALSFMKETSLRPEKWVVLGDMLELGDEEKAYHESLC